MNTWELEQAHRVGREVQRLRKQADLTAQQLADKTGHVGLKMTRQSISDLENGRRRYVTTAELAVLAAALNTAPVSLAYPNPSDVTSATEVLPGVTTTGFKAAQWFSGISSIYIPRTPTAEDKPGAAGAEEAKRRAEFAANTQLLNAWRKLDDLYRRRATITVPKGEQLSPAQRELLDFYNTEIDGQRLLLGVWDGPSGGN